METATDANTRKNSNQYVFSFPVSKYRSSRALPTPFVEKFIPYFKVLRY